MSLPHLHVAILAGPTADQAAFAAALRAAATVPTHVVTMRPAAAQRRETWPHVDCVVLSDTFATPEWVRVARHAGPSASSDNASQRFPAVVAVIDAEKRRIALLEAGAHEVILRDGAEQGALADAVASAIARRTAERRLWQSKPAGAIPFTPSEGSAHDTEDRFRRAIDAAGAAVYYADLISGDPAQTYGVEHIVGSEALGVSHTRDWWHGRIHPEDRERHTSYVARCIATPSCPAFHDEYRVRHSDGSWRYVEDKGSILRGPGGRAERLVGTLVDVTDRHRAEETLERYRLLCEISRDIMLFIRRDDGRIVEANAAAEQAYGRTREELTQMTVAELRAPGHRLGVAQAMEAADRGGVLFETWHVHRTGRIFPVEVNSRGADVGGKRLLLSVVRDISARRRDQADRERLAATLDAYLAGAPVGLAMFDRQLRCVQINEYFATLYGTSTATQFGHTLGELRVAQADTLEPLFRRVLETGEPILNYEIAAAPQDGPDHSRTCLANLFPVRESDGSITGVGAAVLDITSRKRMEEALRNSDLRFRRIFENAPTGIAITHLDGRYEECNQAYLQLVGYTRDELKDMRFPTLVHPDDLAAHRLQLDALLRGDVPYFSIENRYVTRSGEPIWVHKFVTLVPHRSGLPRFLSLVTDVTLRRRSENQLRGLADAAARINAASDVDAVLQLLVDQARQLVGARRAAADLFLDDACASSRSACSFGDSEASQSAAGLPLDAELCATACRSDRPIRLSQSDLAERLQWPASESAGARVVPAPAGWMAARLEGPDGRCIGLVQVADKPAGEFTLEDESILLQLAQMASTAIEKTRLVESLRQTDRRKDEFLATLAHELRNPLAPLRSGLAVLRRSQHDPQRFEEVVALMERQLSQLVRLIDDLLDIGRINRGKIQLRLEPLSMNDMIEEAADAMRPQFSARKQRFEVAVSTETLRVLADPLRVGQMLSNLLTNAAKFTPAEGQISLCLNRAGGFAEVRLRDNGIGIPPDSLTTIFELFAQVDASIERAHGGLGIGLSLVKSLATLHGGSVEARSDGPGTGSEFILRLPLLDSAREKDATTPASAGADAPASKNGPAGGGAEKSGVRRILVVDDNRDSADMLRQFLSLAGDDVRVCYDGPSAIEVAARFRPHVLILDIGMPEMSGYDVARRIRQDGWGRDSVFIALTGWGNPEDRRRAIESGFDHHFTKPVDLDQLSAVLPRRST
jgi:PAS domain S-box-containing protein